MRTTLVRALLVLVAAVCWQVLNGPGASAQDPSASPGSVDGEFLWKRDCASCHGATGAGTVWGPTIVGQGPAGVTWS